MCEAAGEAQQGCHGRANKPARQAGLRSCSCHETPKTACLNSTSAAVRVWQAEAGAAANSHLWVDHLVASLLKQGQHLLMH